jgi:large subunit ribosomal protein L10
MVTEMAHVAPWKEAQVKEMTQIMDSNPVIGLINITGIPGPQMQKMRLNLRDKATIKISKINLISLALKEMENKKKGINKLETLLDGQIALIATDMNPFRLFKVLEDSKTKAPAKGGEVLPEDVDIKAGETAFKPGPIVGELQRVGIPAAIEEGKVVIKADKTLVKAGETISRDVAQMLTRLEIFPMTVGLDLQAVFEDGVIFEKSDLAIDSQEYIDNVALCANYAFNLAFNTNYISPVTILPLIQTAQSNAINLLYNANIISPATIEVMLQKGQCNMLNLISQLDADALDDELKELLGSAITTKDQPTEESKEDKESKDDKQTETEKKEGKEEEKDEEVSEEEAAAGLGQLFG